MHEERNLLLVFQIIQIKKCFYEHDLMSNIILCTVCQRIKQIICKTDAQPHMLVMVYCRELIFGSPLEGNVNSEEVRSGAAMLQSRLYDLCTTWRPCRLSNALLVYESFMLTTIVHMSHLTQHISHQYKCLFRVCYQVEKQLCLPFSECLPSVLRRY